MQNPIVIVVFYLYGCTNDYDICLQQRWIGSFFVTGKNFNGAIKMKKKICF
jgi:hypothetical protein